jgi:hypothetical protein
VLAAERILLRHSADATPQIFHTWPQWRKAEEDYFRETDELQWIGGPASIDASPERAEAVKLLKADAMIGPQLDELVGTHAMGRISLRIDWLLNALVSKSCNVGARFGFSDERFDQAYAHVEETLYSANVEIVTLLPLAGLGSAVRGPIRLNEFLAIDQLTDAEVERVLSLGLLREGGLPMFKNDPPLWGLRLTHGEPKIIGTARPDNATSDGVLSRVESDSMLEDAVAVLRMSRAGSLSPVGRVSYANAPWFPGTFYSVLRIPSMRMVSYRLEGSDVAEVQQLFVGLRAPGVGGRQYVRNAVRRFSFAEERTRPDDRLLDLVIAAESLLLGHMKEVEGELSFRLRLHAAHLLDTDDAERRLVYAAMKLAYATRSAIVHGGEPKPRDWGSTAASPVTLAEFVASIEDLMRRLLQRGIALAGSTPGSGPLMDWEAALLASN